MKWLVFGGLATVMLVALLWADIVLRRQPLAGVVLDTASSYTFVTSFRTDCTSEPAPSLFFDCTFPLAGETLHLHLKYFDSRRNSWAGCTATYRGATFRCESTFKVIGGSLFAVIDPEALGISAEQVAKLRRQHPIINTPKIYWGLVVQGGAVGLALVAGRTVRRKVKSFSVAGGLTVAFFTYWLVTYCLIEYLYALQVLD
ncbi:MAG: hypothetical protein H0T53_00595 [Herpetosiphonaceae bacterium]|nr:hypothetical protein [Herpetosiphonaceae bacterium]